MGMGAYRNLDSRKSMETLALEPIDGKDQGLKDIQRGERKYSKQSYRDGASLVTILYHAVNIKR